MPPHRHPEPASLGRWGQLPWQAGRTRSLQTPATSTPPPWSEPPALMPGDWPAPATAVTQGRASPVLPALAAPCTNLAPGRVLTGRRAGVHHPSAPPGKTLLCCWAPACRSTGSGAALQQEQSGHGGRAGGLSAAATWNKAHAPSPINVVKLGHAPSPKPLPSKTDAFLQGGQTHAYC